MEDEEGRLKVVESWLDCLSLSEHDDQNNNTEYNN